MKTKDFLFATVPYTFLGAFVGSLLLVLFGYEKEQVLFGFLGSWGGSQCIMFVLYYIDNLFPSE